MKKSLISLLTVVLFVFTISSCKKSTTSASDEEKNTTGGDVKITGKVVDNNTGAGLGGVSITNTEDNVVRITEANGEFTFTLAMDMSGLVTFTFTKEGYETQTPQEVQIVVAEGSKDIGTISLAQELINSSVSGPPDAIQFIEMSSPNIFVLETGDITWTNIVYMVVDSNGNAIDIEHSTPVTFSFLAHPDGGEEIGPPVVRTNSKGIAATTIRSGTKAGDVQVIAQVNFNGRIITSRPTKLTISGGFPDLAHFSVGSTQLNYPAYGIINYLPRPRAVALVGDIWSNPVVEGTAVYFNTDACVIEGYNSESPQTDHFGIATVDLMTGAPWPNDPIFGPGYFFIHAQTVDGNNDYITTKSLVLLSGRTILANINPTDFNLPDLGQQVFTFTLMDANGNPLAKGTKVTVVVSGQNLRVRGDVDVEYPDTQDRSYTSFSFVLSEYLGDDGFNYPTREASVTVSVKSPNGDVSYTITGTAN